MKDDEHRIDSPTADLVIQAGIDFDKENETIEGALTELFKQNPGNVNHPHVLLKVVASIAYIPRMSLRCMISRSIFATLVGILILL